MAAQVLLKAKWKKNPIARLVGHLKVREDGDILLSQMWLIELIIHTQSCNCSDTVHL